MRAAVVTAFDRPVSLEERPIPLPGPGQVLVRLETCGVCHTDIHAMRGDWPVKPGLPFVPGHEGVGTSGTRRRRDLTRDRAAGGHGLARPRVRRVPYCVDGRENLCEQQQNTGYSINGGFAEYELADARFAVPVPDGVSPLDAAPLMCAGVTTYAAIKNAHVVPGERVAVFGIGGLGHLAVQYAHRRAEVDRRRRHAGEARPRPRPRRRPRRRRDAGRPDRGDRRRSVAGMSRSCSTATPQLLDQAFAALTAEAGWAVSTAHREALTVPDLRHRGRGLSVIDRSTGPGEGLAEVFACTSSVRTRGTDDP